MMRPAPVPVYAHYDACAGQTAGFAAMAACGKARRTAYCQEHQNCGPEGNAFVEYADGLARSVEAHEITEGDAMRRFAEFKMTMYANVRHDQAVIAAGAAAAPPRNCIRTGNMVSCN